jgi:hypothetical protein
MIKGKTGTRKVGRVRLTWALAVGLLEGGEGSTEVPVLPQQSLEELLPGVEGALHKFKLAVSYASFWQFRAKCFVLNPKLGD